MKATNSSSAFIKMLNSTEATVSVPFSAGPILAEMKIRQVSTSIAMCPANILAKKTNHQCKRFREDPEKLDERHHRHRNFQPPRYIRPENIFPIMFGSENINRKERTDSQYHCDRNISRHIRPTGKEWDQSHYIVDKDEKKTLSADMERISDNWDRHNS